MLVTTWSGNSPPDGKAMLEHVVTIVLKHAKDGLLAKTLLDGGAIHENYWCLHSQPTNKGCPHLPGRQSHCEALSILYKGMLRMLEIFANYCQASSAPNDNWNAVTMKHFVDFRFSKACMIATENNDTFFLLPLPTPKQKNLLSDFIQERDQDKFFPVQCTEGSQAVGFMALLHCGTGTSTRYFWSA